MISEPGETVVVVAGGVVVVAAGGVVEASFSFSAPSVVVTVDAAGGCVATAVESLNLGDSDIFLCVGFPVFRFLLCFSNFLLFFKIPELTIF